MSTMSPQLRRGINSLLDNVEVKATAGSSYTRRTIVKRVRELLLMEQTPEVVEELSYLRNLADRKFPT